MNEIIAIVGRIAADPTLERTATGIPHLRLRVATTPRRRDGASGEWVDDESNFYGVDAYRSLAENAHGSLRKGDRVFVCGRLRLRRWQTAEKSGTSPEITADALGPDLRWGTTTFHAVRSGSRTEDEPAGDGDADTSEEWAVPAGDLADLATPF